MLRLIRSALYLTLAALLSLAALPHLGQAQAQPVLTKHLVGGEWQTGQLAPLTSDVAAPGTQSPPAPAYSTNPGDWRRFVYTTRLEGNDEIYLRTGIPNGTLTMNLTNNRAADTYPRLNHTADQVVFVSDRDRNREIYRMAADGSGVRRLTNAPADDIQPFWSPNGQAIVFASARDGNWNLYRMNADGTNPAPLTSDPSADLMAAWSPDGTQLAFDYDRDGDGFNDLAVINANGSGLRAVPIPATMAQPGQRVDLANASWAPPGNWLVTTMYIYNLAGTKATFVNSYIGSAALDASSSGALIWPAAFDRYPDLQALDLIPPHSTIRALPPWTRGHQVNIAWDGGDEGISGEFWFDVQYRVGTGPWVDWKMHTGDTGDWQANYIGRAGDTVAFRVRARDAAGNTEPWHNINGDTATTFFDTILQGQITDNRARPLADVTLNLAPAAIVPASTGADGRFQTRLIDNGTHTVTAASAGYLSWVATTVPISRDVTFSPYLLPSDNQVQNSGFEAANGLAGWSASGTLPTVVTTTLALTGHHAALLGQPCAAPCLTVGEPIPTGATGFAPYMGLVAVDQADTAHILWSKIDINTFPTINRIYYQSRSAGGVWSTPQYIGDGSAVGIVADEQATLHTVLITPANRLVYLRRPSGGGWSAAQDIGVASSGRLWLDHHNRLYVWYGCANLPQCAGLNTAGYRMRGTDGSWSPAHALPSGTSTFAIGPDDTPYVAWNGDGRGLIAPLQADGSVGVPIRFDSGYQMTSPEVVIDQRGTAHIVWGLNSIIYYVELPRNGIATLPIELSQGGMQYQLLETGGTLYLLNNNDLLNYDPRIQFGIHLRTKPVDGTWSSPVLLWDGTRTFFGMAADGHGRVHIVSQGPYIDQDHFGYYQVVKVASASTATLKQTVAVPANLHRPTLAFAYALSGAMPSNGSALEVTVTQAGQATSVFSSTVGAGWALASVDLQPWAGATVDLGITLHQAGGAPAASAWVDDVSLGSWLTPVIQQVAPAAIAQPSVATTLTISGENFISPPAVFLGTRQLANVQLIDEHTLKVAVPAGIAPGRYKLQVQNPGGQRAIIPDFLVGRQLFLPALAR
jgi:hypothetical protein